MERFDLGAHTRTITTTSADAQRLFNLGLNWCFGFNQEEGATCFEAVLQFDPECAMAHWGLAYAKGPFYNMAWCDFSLPEATECTKICYDHVMAAIALIDHVTPPERALILALQQRFQAPYPVTQSEFNQWDDDYADAMRNAHHAHPDDRDIKAIYIEAIMTRTPWKLWDVKTNKPPAGADTYEALQACETDIATAREQGLPQHPAILHLHIHATEMSPYPEQAMWSADALAMLCPDAGHMNHMPGHTYVLCGDYLKAKDVSTRSIAADDMYVNYAGPYNFYTTARCHDLHLMMYTCMLMGQYKTAIWASERICETLSQDVLSVKGRPQLARTMEGYYSMKMHVLVRFGRWQDIVDAPMPVCDQLYCVSTAMHHYAKGVAFAALKDFENADAQRALFHKTRAAIPADRKFFNNAAVTILGVGEMMLEGELAYHKGDYDHAFACLRESVKRDDALEYTEPWAWMHPPRHALGALLAEQGHLAEAEEVYRTDLGLNDTLQRCAQHPRNVWALHGFVECLRKRGAMDEVATYQPMLDLALSQADVPVKSSCMCRGME
jgi:tetratricopeptide (TPR) repeat protein